LEAPEGDPPEPISRETHEMKRALITAIAVLGVWACGSSRAEEYQAAVDTLTRGQKDSLIAKMPIPGAGAVGRALGAAEDANARTQAHDTIG
jgi:hypothetical protein